VLRGAGRRGAPVVAEYLAEGVSAPMVMVRDGALKYVRCPGDPDVLYDLDADPRELRNLADGTDRGAAARLLAEADRRWDLGRLEEAILDSQRERRLVVPALNRGRHTGWDYVPQSQAMRYIGTNADLYEHQRRARLDTDDRRAS
jgi:choline-sulfatase